MYLCAFETFTLMINGFRRPLVKNKKARLSLTGLFNMAEREGFEPSIPFNGYTPLAGARLRPLGHLSG